MDGLPTSLRIVPMCVAFLLLQELVSQAGSSRYRFISE
jgi:hypothetical protein